MKLFRGIHYAWVICAACSLLLFISMGMNSNTYSVYQPFLIERGGISNTEASLIVTVRSCFGLVGVVTVDKLCGRLGLRRAVCTGIGMQVLSRLVFSAAGSFPVYCLASAMAGLAYSWAGLVPLSSFINNWFDDHRGVAMGIGVSGSGLATILLPPALTAAIQHRGLPFAFRMEALLTAVLMAVIFILMRDTPEELGFAPYRKSTSEQGRTNPGGEPLQDAPAEKFDRAGRLWMMAAVVILAGPAAPGFNHITVLLSSEGYSADRIALLFSFFGIVLMLGKIIDGEIYDKVGSFRANNVIAVSLTGGFLLCAAAPAVNVWISMLTLCLLGLGLPAVSVSMSVWARDLEGAKGREHAMKWYSASYSAGSLLFGPLPGIIADRTGRYIGAYILFTALSAISLLMVQGCYRRKMKAGTIDF